MKNRKINIDILKVIGLLCIVLAHVKPPEIIFRLRNFDVILMILISAYLGIKSYKDIKYFEYIKKRFKRLIIPTWTFLIFFFVIAYIFKLCNIDKNIIFNSFNLTSGIGYVWIIRIYFIISVLIPLFIKQKNSINGIFNILIIIFLLLIQEILSINGIFENITIRDIFGYFIPCYVLIFISHYLFNSNKKSTILVSSISLLIYVSLIIYFNITSGNIPSTQLYKYPFRIYYLSYGVFVSGLLILIFKSNKLCELINNKFITFISKESLNIYLWHILIIYILKQIDLKWYIRYIIILIISILLVYINTKIGQYYEKIKFKIKNYN